MVSPAIYWFLVLDLAIYWFLVLDLGIHPFPAQMTTKMTKHLLFCDPLSGTDALWVVLASIEEH